MRGGLVSAFITFVGPIRLDEGDTHAARNDYRDEGQRSDGMSVSESWADITLNGTTGYTTTTRQEWTVSGIADACIGDSLALAVKSVAGNGTAANTFVPIPVATVSDNGDANNNTVTLSVPEGYNNGVYAGNTPSDASVNRSAVTDTVGYSIKIS